MNISRSVRPLTYCFRVATYRKSCRLYATNETIMNVFDRNAKRMQRDRTAVLPDYKVYEYIKEESCGNTMPDLSSLSQFPEDKVFNTVVELGCGRGYVSRHILKENAHTIYQCELSKKMLMQSEVSPEVPTYRVVADEEFFPFKDNSLDMVVSSLSLHWVNDLPGCFRQVYNSLKNDGVFLGCMFGADTLFELRVSLQLAETEREGGFGVHVSPFTEVNDLGNLLNKAGFNMLTIDIDDIVITYPSMIELMQDLKGMGENNCSWNRKPVLHRDTMTAAAAIYKDMYGNEEGVPATYRVLYFIGWKPDPSQAKAAKRGSGQVSLKDLGRIDEISKEFEALYKDKPKPSQEDT